MVSKSRAILIHPSRCHLERRMSLAPDVHRYTPGYALSLRGGSEQRVILLASTQSTRQLVDANLLSLVADKVKSLLLLRSCHLSRSATAVVCFECCSQVLGTKRWSGRCGLDLVDASMWVIYPAHGSSPKKACTIPCCVKYLTRRPTTPSKLLIS